MNNKILGAQGEKQAVNYIKRMGYKILATNFTTKIGEIDIIAQDNNYIVFVEEYLRKNFIQRDKRIEKFTAYAYCQNA